MIYKTDPHQIEWVANERAEGSGNSFDEASDDNPDDVVVRAFVAPGNLHTDCHDLVGLRLSK